MNTPASVTTNTAKSAIQGTYKTFRSPLTDDGDSSAMAIHGIVCDRNGGSSGVAEKPNIAIRFQSHARIHPGSLYDPRLSGFTCDGLEPEADALSVYCHKMYCRHIGLMGATPFRLSQISHFIPRRFLSRDLRQG